MPACNQKLTSFVQSVATDADNLKNQVKKGEKYDDVEVPDLAVMTDTIDESPEVA